MDLAKGFIQATVIVLWMVYAVVQIARSTGGAGSPDPTGGAGLVRGFLATLPLDTLVISTAVMVGVLVAVEAVFVVVRRVGAR